MKKDPRLLARQLYSAPRDPAVDKLHKRHNDLNAFISARNGFVTSVPGSQEIRFDAIHGSTLPEELRALGWGVAKTGESQRILAGALIERFVAKANGEYELLTEPSTKPIARTVTHAGIVAVEQFEIFEPSAAPDQGMRIWP
jgi:hypothetical protein